MDRDTPLPYPEWQNAYRDAVLEVDRSNLLKGGTDAETAISI